MKIKMNELKEIPLRIVNQLQEIKLMEENNNQRLKIYTDKVREIKEEYQELERLVNNWNEE